MFIIVDGIDGSGKGTIVEVMAAALDRAGKRVFDLRDYQKKQRTLPVAAELQEYDVIISAEPTYSWIGAAIREEMIHSNEYSGRSFADAFALQREVLYRRLLIPLRQANKIILQERGVSTSLAYQVAQGISEDDIQNRPGNALALEHSPDVLILAIVEVDEALRRLVRRTQKQDEAIFEKRGFLAKVAERYSSTFFHDLFSSRGTRVVSFDTSGPVEAAQQKAVQLLQEILSTKS